jgi:hypothetical protein
MSYHVALTHPEMARAKEAQEIFLREMHAQERGELKQGADAARWEMIAAARTGRPFIASEWSFAAAGRITHSSGGTWFGPGGTYTVAFGGRIAATCFNCSEDLYDTVYDDATYVRDICAEQRWRIYGRGGGASPLGAPPMVPEVWAVGVAVEEGEDFMPWVTEKPVEQRLLAVR